MNTIVTVEDAKKMDEYLDKTMLKLDLKKYQASYSYFQGDECTIEYCEMTNSPIMDFSMFNGKKFVRLDVYVNTTTKEVDKFVKSNLY